MTSGKFRAIVFRRPFHPFRIRLQDGDPVGVRHPENIAMDPSGSMVVVLLPPPKYFVFFEPETVVAVEQSRNGRVRK